DELLKLHCEANTLYWAKVLLAMTYEFIYSAISSAEHPPLFEIPKLRFVEAGLALAHSQSKGPGPINPKLSGMASGMYLLEEKIEGGHVVFKKFIHNMDCGPSLDE
ncbi:hypothetical protein BKA82DRAFT_3944814, partial [Pisolithus tinctorius]